MKTILFHMNHLQGGGIEKVLIELLWGLDPSKYRIRLSIGHKLDELEVLRGQVPPYVEVTYILDSPLLTNTKKKKILKKISFPEKLFEDIILPLFKKRIHTKKLKQLIKDTDIVIDFDMTLAAYAKLLRDKKKVAYCHFSFIHYWGGDKRKLDKHANRLRKYDTVVMLCDEMRDNAVQLYPFLKENTIRIYNALNFDRIKAMAQEPINEHQYLPDAGYFISVGRLAESQKDFTMLLKGYANCVKKYGIKEHLVIIGAGPSRPVLEALAIEEGIENQVLFTGYQANPYKWIAKSKLFLFCSKFEGLPTVLIEALSLSRPVVATATPTGAEEILMQGKAGILIKPGDVTALSESIFLLLNNAGLQASFRENAQDILRQFEIKYMVREFERLVIG
jgi:glycosyltransferase involved in cell wall biosynthesis